MRRLKEIRKSLPTLLLGAVFALLNVSCVAKPATLVEKGQVRCVIVTPAEPDANEQKAADELAHYLGKMSGVPVPVVKAGEPTDKGVTRILIGSAATAEIPDLKVERAFAGKDDLSSKDGFVLRVTDDAIALAGPSSRGTLNAAYELLERLGVRWYFPGELGENVPQKADLSLAPCDDVQIPSFDLRTMWFSGRGGNDDWEGELNPWMQRMRSGGFEWSAQHNMDDVKAPTDEYVQKVVDRILAHLDQYPNQKIYSLGWSDSYAYITPEMGLGVQHPWHKIPQASDALMGFYDQIIKIVEKKYPNVRYGFQCYMNYLTAPISAPINPALQPMIAPIEQCPRHAPGTGECWQRDALLEAVRAWGKNTPNAIIYDYEPGFLIDNDVPIPCVSRMRIEYPLWHQAGMRGLYCQAQMSVPNNGPNLYVRWKLAWNVNADVDAVLNDYFDGLYGPAGKPAQAYWMALEEMMCHGPGHAHEDEIIKAIYPIEKIRALETHIKQAEALADTEVLKARVKALRFGHDNLMAYLEMRQAEDEGRFADAARLAQQVHEMHQTIEAFNTNFVSIGDLDRPDETAPFLIEGIRAHNEERASRIDGTKGKLVAMLPDAWSFRLDPGNEGLSHRWFTPEKWQEGHNKTMRTTRIWEMQGLEDNVGHGYDGIGWYATTVDVPAEFAGKTVQLNFGPTFGQMLIWINGQFVQHVPYKIPWWQNPPNPVIDVDVTGAIKPGEKNTIVIRLDNEFEWGGIIRRVFLWSPLE